MIHFVVPHSSEFGMQDYLRVHGLGLAGRMTVHHYEDLPRCTFLPGGAYVFSALDQLTPAGRGFADTTANQLATAGVPILNRPGRVLLRLELLDELFRRGLNRHRAVRATADLAGLRYPVFLRHESFHTGALSPLIHNLGMLRAELGRAMLRGLVMDDLLVMEFCDTSAADGSFRKYAAFRVGTQVMPRSLAHGEAWALKHSGSTFSRETADEERRYMMENPHEAALREIFAIAGVDYGRIDYSLTDGAIETWEINLNPTIGRGSRSTTVLSPEIQAYRAIARDHFYRRFQAAFEAIDVYQGAAAIPVSFSPKLLAGLRPMSRAPLPPPRFEPIRRIFRPFRRVLEPIVRILAPLLGKAARG